jgi:hypothetical protein
VEVEFISFDGKSLAPAPEAGRWSRRFVTRRDGEAHWRERSRDQRGHCAQMAPCKSGIGRRAERGTGPLIHEHEHEVMNMNTPRHGSCLFEVGTSFFVLWPGMGRCASQSARERD